MYLEPKSITYNKISIIHYQIFMQQTAKFTCFMGYLPSLTGNVYIPVIKLSIYPAVIRHGKDYR